jgi:hypothetical protein
LSRFCHQWLLNSHLLRFCMSHAHVLSSSIRTHLLIRLNRPNETSRWRPSYNRKPIFLARQVALNSRYRSAWPSFCCMLRSDSFKVNEEMDAILGLLAASSPCETSLFNANSADGGQLLLPLTPRGLDDTSLIEVSPTPPFAASEVSFRSSSLVSRLTLIERNSHTPSPNGWCPYQTMSSQNVKTASPIAKTLRKACPQARSKRFRLSVWSSRLPKLLPSNM